MCIFQSGIYEKVHIFASREADGRGDGWFRLTDSSGKGMEVHLGLDRYRRVCLPLQPGETYRIKKSGNVAIAQIYLSDCPDQMERGVEFVDPDRGGAVELGSWFDTPWREQYHFVPFINWLNDPNGLCWYQGYYHLFYQTNPFKQEWGDMYWGHAVSKDLIHWVSQPHVLDPQPELWRSPNRKGGAFSGSAVVEKDGIHLYLTRHEGPLQDGEESREWQTHAICRDGLHVEEERMLILEKPSGVAYDFRDPKVEQIGGERYLVLGACLEGRPSILLYNQRENGRKDSGCRKEGLMTGGEWKQSWEYLGPLVQELTPGIRTIECPDFFSVDGCEVAVGAWMCHYDQEGRYQMTRCYIGSFDGNKFQVKREQWFDFGSNFYAVQSFAHEGRRIAIGWISDFLGEHRVEKNGAYGSFSLPREVHVKDGRLCLTPVRECYELLREKILKCADVTYVKRITIPGNSYYVHMSLDGDGDFSILLAQDGEDTLTLEKKGRVTGFVSGKKEVRDVRFPADISCVKEIEIFVDRRVTEVFLNRGEAAGTKVFYQESRDGCFEARISGGSIRTLTVCQMESIWGKQTDVIKDVR